MSCYVIGCKSGNGSSSKDHLFTCPKSATDETKAKWTINIPKRKDKAYDILKSKICHLHFEEKFIVKTSKVMMGSEIMKEVPRKKWQLTNEAFPTTFSSFKIPSYYDKKAYVRKPPNPRETPFRRTYAATAKPCSSPQGLNVDAVLELNINTPSAASETLQDSAFMAQLREIVLPKNWTIQEKPQSMLLCKFNEEVVDNVVTFFVERSLEVHQNNKLVAKLRSKEVSNDFTPPSRPTDVSDMLKKLDDKSLCTGIKNINMIKSFPSATKQGSHWYSTTCSIILPDDETICRHCETLKSQLLKAAAQSLKRKTPAAIKPSVELLSIARKKVKVAKVQARRLKIKVDEMKKIQQQLQATTLEKLEDAIKAEANIPSQMKLTILTSLKYAKSKGKGMRYDSDWILQALLIKIRSPKGYRQLRDDKVIPLPHPNHLTQYLRGIPCQFGFSSFVFKELELQFKDKSRRDCQVVVLFDEVKVQEAISFDKSTMNFQGFIDYAEFSGEVKSKQKEAQEADHCLVFMIQSLNSNMNQPIASFATRGAAPGIILAKMIISCITRLEQINIQVVGVVCDGAATNKAAWKELGVGIKGETIVNKISNPVDETRSVFFFCDIPHVLKCIRNNFLKKEVARFQGGIINWAFYKALFDVDRQSDIRAVPKLTNQHVNPGPFQKMVVSHAAQIFSNSVATGLEYYRDSCKNPLFRGSELTQKFTKIINDLFDCCNGRRPGQGLKPGSDKFNMIVEFLNLISPDDSYAADVTVVSLRVTLTSITEATIYLCEEVGYAYVLPGKFNQDKLERFFGLLRSFGGDDSHPTITSFTHLFRLLSIYTPTAKTIHGNVKTDNESSLAVNAYVEALKSLRKTVNARNKDNREKLEETLLSKLFSGEVEHSVLQSVLHDHSYCLPSPLRPITYKLCGFVAYKSKSLTKCSSCIESLVDRNPGTSESVFTKMKDFGGLTYPSSALVRLICDCIEPSLSEKLKSIDDPTVFVQAFMEGLENINILGIGCSPEHSSKLAVSIVFYYVTIRIWFFTKNKNKEEHHGRLAKKNKMKMAKLT